MKPIKVESAIKSYHKLLTQTQFKIKHVRILIIFTHQSKSSIYNLIDQESRTHMKSIRIPIILFKIIQQGHLLNTLEITRCSQYCHGPLGELLKLKINIHSQYHEFDGQFTYEEFIALKYSQVVDVGFDILTQLLEYLNKCNTTMQYYLNQLSTISQNTELLVLMTCFILESYNIYIYILHMGRALHKRIADTEALSQIRADYKKFAMNTNSLFDQAKRWKQLLIYMTIPTIKYLDMMEYDEIVNEKIEFRDIDDNASEVSFGDTELTHSHSTPQISQSQSREFLDTNDAFEMELANQQRLKQQQQQQQQSQVSHASAQEMSQLTNQLSQLSTQNQSNLQIIAQLQQQLNELQQKYDQLANLYKSLRQEHLTLLNNYNQLKSTNDPNLQAKFKQSQLQCADLMKQRDVAVNQLNALKSEQSLKVGQLQQQYDLLQLQNKELKQTRGNEINLNLQNQMQAQINALNQQYSDLQNKYNLLNSEMVNKNEEIQVLQYSLDQALKSNDTNLMKHLDGLLDALFHQLSQSIVTNCQSLKSSELDPNLSHFVESFPLAHFSESVMTWLDTNDKMVVMGSALDIGFKMLQILNVGCHETELMNNLGMAMGDYFNHLKSSVLLNRSKPDRIEMVKKCHANVETYKNQLLQSLSTNQVSNELNLQSVLQQVSQAHSQLINLVQLNTNHVHYSILKQCLLLSDLLQRYVQSCINTQQEIISHSNTTPNQFYKANNRWTQGLISASQVINFYVGSCWSRSITC
eukprot:NODE_18_length_47517_cov_0.674814.p3 type:complete len:752 gc:universal NODE_18_length_47517_cov_0.674814:28007-30262(+)